MRSINCIQKEHEDLYRSCIGQTQNAQRRAMLETMTQRVVDAGESYATALTAGRPDSVVAMAMSDEEKEQISKVYDSRLVSKKGVERETYDQIRTLVGKCPFCGFGEVWEVDHYLPKDQFPELNVLPNNLVPICHGCNHTKLTSLPEAANRSLLHPYFDVLPNEKWMFARLNIEEGGPVLEYFAQLDTRHGALSDRLSFHFTKLELPRRMKSISAQVLVEMEADIEEHLSNFGEQWISDHFRDQGERVFRRHGNTIEMAAYFAAAQNLNYCAGAYRS